MHLRMTASSSFQGRCGGHQNIPGSAFTILKLTIPRKRTKCIVFQTLSSTPFVVSELINSKARFCQHSFRTGFNILKHLFSCRSLYPSKFYFSLSSSDHPHPRCATCQINPPQPTSPALQMAQYLRAAVQTRTVSRMASA